MTLPPDVVSQSAGGDLSLLKRTNALLILYFFTHSLLQIKLHCAKGGTDPKGGGKKKEKNPTSSA